MIIECVSEMFVNVRNSFKVWFIIYLGVTGVFSVLFSLSVHLMGAGFILCLLTIIKLPSPDPVHVSKVLNDLYHQTTVHGAAGVVAHRAACLDAPENSVEAVQRAVMNGATWIEFDISFTSDGVGVVFHDDTLDRATNGSGLIVDYTFSQLQQLFLVDPGPFHLSHSKIATVDQFVGECLANNVRMIIDLKTYMNPTETVQLMRELYRRYPSLIHNSIVTSFFPNLLYKLRQSDPSIVTAISTRPMFLSAQCWEGTQASIRPRFSGVRQLVARAGDAVFQPLLETVLWWVLGLSAVLVHRLHTGQEMVDTWHRRGVTVMAWTVNCPKEKQFYSEVLKIPILTDTIRDNKLIDEASD